MSSSVPVLNTERLTLCPFEMTDAPRFRELAGAKEVADLASFKVGCQEAALIMRGLAPIFPGDWPLELRDAPIAYGDPAPTKL